MSQAERISALIDRALVSEDEAWPTAEQAVIDAVAAGESIDPGLSHPDAVGRLLATSAHERATAGNDDPMRRADAYLRRVATAIAKTEALVPPVIGVVEALSRGFGSQLSRALALQLVQQPRAPHWRVLTAIAYADRHKDPTTTVALVRFAARTTVDAQRTAAVHVLRNLGDPALPAKITAERDRLARAGQTMPTVVAALASGAAIA